MECPVCLTAYDAVSCVPRVIPCGHSFCSGCLALLPHPFPGTIRCPACNGLLNCSNSFPKNIDLLRLSPGPALQPSKRAALDYQPSFIPEPWSPEFYQYWIRWLLPATVISTHQQDHQLHIQPGSVVPADQSSCRKSLFAGILRDSDAVALLELGFTSPTNKQDIIKYDCEARVINFLYVMGDQRRDDLRLLMDTSLRLHRTGKVYGVWGHDGDDCVYMVCQRFTSFWVDKTLCFQDGSKDMVDYGIRVGAEMCEIVCGLHSEGLLVGCFGIACFGFDHFGTVYFDFGNAIATARRVSGIISNFISDQVGMVSEELRLRDYVLEYGVFSSPEVLAKIIGNKGVEELGCDYSEFEVCCGSDVWSLACLLVWLLTEKSFAEEMYNYYLLLLVESRNGKESWLGLYMGWVKEVAALLDKRLGTEFDLLKKMLCKCLEFQPVNRPSLDKLWRCIKVNIIKSEFEVVKSVRLGATQESIKYCIVLGELCRFDKVIVNCTTNDVSEGNDDGIRSVEHEGNSMIDKDIGEGVSKGKMKSIDIKGHTDCITSLIVGGGFLFSSSYDRTVKVWSLQDFTHVLSLKGHEHRVMAVVYVDETSLCIGGDNGGGICIWNAKVPLDTEPIKKLNEHKDWRYSGIHAMAVSGAQYLYTGSGDKTIKAWALQDYTLTCIMSGHKSVVSSLAVNSGVLYSGSWDGTIRLWCISDHSPLAVMGEDTPDNISPVLDLAAEHSLIFVSHEDGRVKVWQNDRLLITKKAHDGAIFAVIKKERWLFAGGWDKSVSLQELSGDGAESDISIVGYVPSESVITALAYWQGKLFVGQADSLIKVYYSIL